MYSGKLSLIGLVEEVEFSRGQKAVRYQSEDGRRLQFENKAGLCEVKEGKSRRKACKGSRTILTWYLYFKE